MWRWNATASARSWKAFCGCLGRLAQRLRSLEHEGILRRQPSTHGRGALYYLTPASLELFEDVVLALGTWGARWLDTGPADYDPVVVLWCVSL